jgi:glyoxylate/hydroxypyruvate reductase A
LATDTTSRPILVVKSGGPAAMPAWQRHFAAFAPQIEVAWLNDPATDVGRVRWALVWEPDPGRLAQFPNLKLIVSDAVGVGHILRDPSLPKGIPIVRMGGEELGQRMGEYVCMACLALLRDLSRSLSNQRAHLWDEFTPDRTARDTRVGILGFGRLGGRAAAMLLALGFAVAGWSNSRKQCPGVESFAGQAELAALLARSDLLVNLLPETPATRGILCADTLALLPPGAGVVNTGRGSHLILPDLLGAIDSGHLCGAVLDVFEPEPLAPESPAWSHPRIIITAHGAAYHTPRGRARYAADAILTDLRGEPPANLYDPALGY